MAELLRSPGASVLRPVGAVSRNGWVSWTADRRSWDGADGYTGVPGILRDDLSYWWERPAGSMLIRRGRHPVPTKPCPDPVLAVRRWTASRVARVAAHHRLPVAGTLEELGVREEELSMDARAALRGLASEGDVLQPDEVPGFRCPDAAYRSADDADRAPAADDADRAPAADDSPGGDGAPPRPSRRGRR